MTATTYLPPTTDTIRPGRHLDVPVAARQIGVPTLMAVSGLRIQGSRTGDTLRLPIGGTSGGREVWVTLNAADEYDVRRVRRVFRGAQKGETIIERTFEGVDPAALSQIVFDASCWK